MYCRQSITPRLDSPTTGPRARQSPFGTGRKGGVSGARLSHELQRSPLDALKRGASQSRHTILRVRREQKVHSVHVKNYGDDLHEYEFHPESKCADEKGNPCGRQTIGPLYQRYIRIDYIVCIGKESNTLEDVDAGLIHSEKSVYTEYPGPKWDEWQMKILPVLKKIPLSTLVKKAECPAANSRRSEQGEVDRNRKRKKCRENVVKLDSLDKRVELSRRVASFSP